MTNKHTMKLDELEALFPSGVPLSVHMIAERPELEACAKNELIRQLAGELKSPPGTRAAHRFAQEVGTLARMEALQEAHDIVKMQLLWANSKLLCSKNNMAARIGERIARAARRPYKLSDSNE